MTNADKRPFAEMMMGLGLAYKEPITEPLTDLYFKALADLAIEDVRRAGEQILKTSKWFPRVSQFYDVVNGDAQDQAQQAWGLLTDAVGTVGGYRSLVVPDTKLSYALQTTFGGWDECCSKLTLPDDPMYANLQKQFVGNYRHAQRSGSAAPSYYVGRSEAANRANASTFERGDPSIDEAGEPCFDQKVGAIIAGQVVFLNLNFNIMTGALTAQSRQFLQGGHLQLTEGT